MLFAHLKCDLGFERMRLRGLNGARDEFLPAATVESGCQKRRTSRLYQLHRSTRDILQPLSVATAGRGVIGSEACGTVGGWLLAADS